MSQEVEDELAYEIAKREFDPLGFVNFSYEWGEGELEGESLREWQKETFGYISKQLADPLTRYNPIRIAIVSGHGIGKSAFIGMLLNWGMSCFVDCKGLVTANTETQLRTKTWPEVSKWFRRSITSHWFGVTASSVYSKDRAHEKTWRSDAISWSENNTEAFAGIHNKKKIIIIVYDEASGISDKVWETTEGALTDEETIIIWVVFGNGTRNSGRFRECFSKFRHLWFGKQIDSRDVEGTNKKQLQEWIDAYGEDSDFVKVRVRGMFPATSFKQFISTEDVDKSFGKHLRESEYNWAPKILTLDNSWTGEDEGVIGLRQGLYFKVLHTFQYNDNDVQVANVLANFEDSEKADAVFIDSGMGTGVASVGNSLGRHWRLVWFSEKASNPGYLNKRAEMYGNVKEWLKAGGAIPKDQILYQDLVGPEVVARVDGKIQLESKIDMKARGLPSPGRGDALALSFAFPIQKKTIGHQQTGKAIHEYDPFN